jgi:hypothetical protein
MLNSHTDTKERREHYKYCWTKKMHSKSYVFCFFPLFMSLCLFMCVCVVLCRPKNNTNANKLARLFTAKSSGKWMEWKNAVPKIAHSTCLVTRRVCLCYFYNRQNKILCCVVSCILLVDYDVIQQPSKWASRCRIITISFSFDTVSPTSLTLSCFISFALLRRDKNHMENCAQKT